MTVEYVFLILIMNQVYIQQDGLGKEKNFDMAMVKIDKN